jgi:hypothetical protein
MGRTRTRTINVLFEFKVRQGGFAMIYRGVKDRTGAYRMEKRRANARVFKPYLFTDKLDKNEQMKNVLSRTCTALIEG